jgi:hypothetical protein
VYGIVDDRMGDGMIVGCFSFLVGRGGIFGSGAFLYNLDRQTRFSVARATSDAASDNKRVRAIIIRIVWVGLS